MLRFFTLFLLFGVLLTAASTKEELDAAKKNLYSTGSKSNLFKAYDTYKNHYLKALMANDVETQKRCLDGIVIAGEKLHIDIGNYEKKRAALKSQSGG
ncbi:N-acetylmuramoyl-L-alanine amidase, partial [bacterium]|nr:N-acetylmuramoyl-L-alanine amidase [bacterium]